MPDLAAKARRTKVYENRNELLGEIEFIARTLKAGLCAAKRLDHLGIRTVELVDALARSQDQLCGVVGLVEFAVKQVEQEQIDAE